MYRDRKILLEKLESLRGRPLITYVTSIRPNMSANMAGDVVSQIIQQIDAISDENKSVDFLIVSNGGDPITALRIMSLLRERFDNISVLLPYVAYSAATVLALGADEIVMHPYSNLGPVDPQLTVSQDNEHGVPKQFHFGSEDLRNYIEFIKNDVGITDQAHLVSAIQPLLKDVGTLPIGSAKRSQQLTFSLSEKMLAWHIKDANKIKSIAKALNTSYYHHGYAVGRTEANEIGLPISFPTKEIEKVLWEIWYDYSCEMKCDDPFDFIKEVMEDNKANKQISQVPIVDLPANTPPEIAQQIIIQHAQQSPITTRSALKRRVLIAATESTRMSKVFSKNIEILYWRNPDMTLGLNFTVSNTGWIDNE